MSRVPAEYTRQQYTEFFIFTLSLIHSVSVLSISDYSVFAYFDTSETFSLEVRDLFVDFRFPSSLPTSIPEFSRQIYALVSNGIDLKETPEGPVFMADLPGLENEELMVEVDDDRRVLQNFAK